MITYYSGKQEMLTFDSWAQRLADTQTSENEMFHQLIVAFWNGEFPNDDIWFDLHTYFEERFDDIDDDIKPGFIKLGPPAGPRWEVLEYMYNGGSESLAHEAQAQLGPHERLKFDNKPIKPPEEEKAPFEWMAQRSLSKYSDQDLFILGLIAVTAEPIARRGGENEKAEQEAFDPEVRCVDWLSQLHKEFGDSKPQSKGEILKKAIKALPRLGERGFNRAWENTVPPSWKKAGAVKKQDKKTITAPIK